jgi:hypothetical protein
MSAAHDDKWVVSGVDWERGLVSYSSYAISDIVAKAREMILNGSKDVTVLGPNGIKHSATEDPLKTILSNPGQ